MRIDAHHHFWQYRQEEYGWIDGRMSALKRDFLPSDLAEAMKVSRVDASIAVQARQTLQETEWLVELARKHEWIAGIIGWAPITAPDFATQLDRMQGFARVKGLRHVVQDEQTGYLARSDFNLGMNLLKDTHLVYELLIYSHQLREAVAFVDRHPHQLFVLDHVAKPNLQKPDFEGWRKDIAEMALRPHIVCKISGMVTEANWAAWSPGQLHPYFETVLEAFSPNRLMVGTDWPVLTLACTYSRWWQIIADWLTPLSLREREQIEGKVAQRVYRLHLPKRKLHEGC